MARRFIFEQKHQPLLPYHQFLKRILRCVLWAGALLTFTISFGTIGYHVIEQQAWIDAMLNSVLIMSGLGLVHEITTFNGKLFTSFFALVSPIAFYSFLAILFAPLLHRFLHNFHLDK